MQSVAKQNIVLVGVGNTFRRDDGIGIVIARKLRDRLTTPARAMVSIAESSGESTDLISHFEQADCVYLFDAVMSNTANAKPGSIQRLEASQEDYSADFFQHSSHAFSLAEAVELARAEDKLPSKLIVYEVAAKEFGHGEGLTPKVDAAGNEIVNKVLAELN